MPKRVADGAEGSEDGNGVYCFIRDLIVEGKDAKLVNGKGRFVINWSRALDRYADYKSKKNPQFKCKKYNRRTASNGLRSALLNFYKKEGAKEYKESKQVNEKDEVVERQFQMPPRVFASLFGEVQLTEKSEQDRQETSSTASEGEMDAQVSPNSSSSDTGFDEFMDMSFHDVDFEAPEAGSSNVPGDIPTGPCLNVVKTEEDGEGGDVLLTDTSFPSQMFDDASALDSALEEICSDGPSDEISEDMDLLGVVQDICPTSGSVKGGYQFYISLTEQLPDDVTSGTANFEGVASVKVHKLNPFTLSGTVPASHQPGDVPVTVVTQTGQRLGMTCFRYVDEMREMVRQLVKDPALQSLWFAIWSQEHGFFGNDSNIAQVLGPLNVQDQDSSSQTKQQQSLKVLQLLVYTAAQTDAQQFIEMIFSTSAGQVVFNSYKDRTPLPEDVARANGHEDLAQYLQDVNIRLSKLTTNDVQANAIDWLELVKAVQNQASVAQDESSKPLKQSRDNDDNSSEYFADAETSSCGSFDLDDVYDSDSDNKESPDKEPCTSDGICKPEPNDRPIICEEDPSSKISFEKVEPADSKEDERVSKWGFTYSLSEWLNKWRKKEDNSSMPQAAPLDKKVKTESSTTTGFLLESLFGKGDASCEATVNRARNTRTAKPKEHGQHNHARSPRKTDPGLKYRGILLACVLVTVLVGLKLGEGQILHWAVGSGYTRISKLLLHCGLYVDAPGFLKETPLHLASKNGFKDLVDILVQSGGNVNARNFPKQETPLHLAAQNGHPYIAEYLIQHGSKVNIRNDPLQDTPLHLASRNGHGQVVDILLQHGSDVDARNAPSQNTPLHLAAQNGHRQVADILLQGGSDVNARNFPRQESPLHLAARNGHQHIVEFLIQHGGKVNSRNVPWRKTPLHVAAQKGHKQVAGILVEQGSDVNARNFPRQETPLHLAILTELSGKLASKSGHQNIAEVLLQHRSTVKVQNVQGKETSLHLASRNGHRQVADILLQHGSDVRARSTPLQNTLRHHAVQNGHKQMADILVQNGSDVNAQNSPRQETPLHLAAQNGHQHIAAFLIQHGGKVNSRNVPWRETTLHLAAQKGHQYIPEVFIQHGSHVIARNVPWEETRLHLAAQNDHREVADVLSRHGSDVSTRGSIRQNSPLYLASKDGHTQVSDVLTQHGSNVSSRHELDPALLHLSVLTGNESHLNVEFMSPIHLAAQCRHQEMSEFSLKHGRFTRSIPLDAMFAYLKVKKQHNHASEVFLRKDRKKKYLTNNTPLQLMEDYSDQHVVELLAAEYNTAGIFNTNTVPFQGNKQPVEVLTHHGKSDANARNKLQLSSISLKAQKEHKKGKEFLVASSSSQHKRTVIAFGQPCHSSPDIKDINEHHHLLNELGVSGNNNSVPSRNRQARCRHFKANITHLTTPSLKDDFPVSSLYPFDIICKRSPSFSKRWAKTRCKISHKIINSRRICQKRCCQVSSKWRFMPICTRRKQKRVHVQTCCSCSKLLCPSFMRGYTERTMDVELLMDNVLPPNMNSYNHCQLRFTKSIGLVVVTGALLTLCFAVTLFFWWKHQYPSRNKTTRCSGYEPQKIKQQITELPMGCAFKECKQCVDLGIELYMMEEDNNQILHLDDLPMNHACPEELRMERVRTWLTSNLEEGLLCVHIEDVIVRKKSSTVIKENNIMFRTIPAHVTEQLGHFLNSNTVNNWKILAGKLGYDSTYTQSFGVTPTEATQRLLQDWQQRRGATVFVLYTHLKEMGRDDAATKLLPFLCEQACETQVSLSSSCPISFPLQPDTFKYHAFIVCNHDTSNWTDHQIRFLVEISNEDPGKLQLNFDPTYDVLTVANCSGAIITVCSSKAIQDNPLSEAGCLIDVLAGTQGNISGALCVQCAKVTNSRGWVIFTDSPTKNRCCRNVKCVGFSGMLKDVTALSTATKRQGSCSREFANVKRRVATTQETARRTERKMESCNTHNRSHRVLQAMQWKSGVPSEGELLIIGHQLKNIGDKFETSEDKRGQQSKKETEKESRNSVKVPRNAMKCFCGNRDKDPLL